MPKLFFKQATGTRTCNYETTEVWTDGYEEAGGKTADEVKQCIDECFAAFDRPGAELKACVAKCKE